MEVYIQEKIDYEVLESFYDIKSQIGVLRIKTSAQLEVGKVYDFYFDDGYDCNCFSYKILKKIDNIYYISQYYFDKFYKYDEKLLCENWIKCDIKEKLNIEI